MKLKTLLDGFLVFVVVLMSVQTAHAQLRVAVGDFENQTHDLVLDGWARNLSDYLSSELSQSKDLVLVERTRLNEIMKEYHLALSGLINDSSKAEQVGKLAGADVLISGIITKIEHRYVILAHLTRVKNGEVSVERVEAPDRKHFKEMVGLLANNIKFRLTAWGKYQTQVAINKYPTLYFLATSLATAASAYILNSQFSKAQSDYTEEHRLDRIQPAYDKANRLYKWRNAVWTVAAGSFAAALVSFIHNRFAKKIQAASDETSQMGWQPVFRQNGKEVQIGLALHF